MAQLIVPIEVINANSGYADAAGLDLAALAGNADLGVIQTNETRNLIIRVSNTAAAAANFTVQAGVNPPSVRSAGDLVISVAAGKTEYIVLESERFVDANGNITVSADAGMTGDVRAYQIGSGA